MTALHRFPHRFFLFAAAGLALAAALPALAQTQAPAPRSLTNLSTRGFAGTGHQVLTPGFVVEGPPDQFRVYLARGVGPGLGAFGITGTLPSVSLRVFAAGPTLLLTQGSWGVQRGGFTLEQFYASRNWTPTLARLVPGTSSHTNATTALASARFAPEWVAAISARVGAFPLAAGSHDAATVFAVRPGVYTFEVSGPTPTTTGTALAELYELVSVPTHLAPQGSLKGFHFDIETPPGGDYFYGAWIRFGEVGVDLGGRPPGSPPGTPHISANMSYLVARPVPPGSLGENITYDAFWTWPNTLAPNVRVDVITRYDNGLAVGRQERWILTSIWETPTSGWILPEWRDTPPDFANIRVRPPGTGGVAGEAAIVPMRFTFGPRTGFP